jgi:hypothetical protein
MLGGTVDALRRSGHRHVVLDLRGLHAAEDAAVATIHVLSDRIAAEGGRCTLLDRVS